jgi:LuxR family maltose regulon positive regulatory protein
VSVPVSILTDSSAGSAAAFGTILRRHRQRAGLSQAALAERASLSAAAIAALELGQRRQPHPYTLRRLAEALELDEQEEAAWVRVIERGGPRLTEASRQNEQPRSFKAPATPLIGRAAELEALTQLLTVSPAARLVTITGPGGVGKTRLALAAAAVVQSHFADGAVFVELAALRDPRLVAASIAAAIDIRETLTASSDDELLGLLAHRQVLLVLDNFEHVTGAATLVASVIEACPRVSILVTSRTPLRVRAERRFPLDPLSVPEAVRLFTDRAQAVSPGFALTPQNDESVAAVCRRLDGLPLPIELAAARIVQLSPGALLARLNRPLAVLTDGAADLPERQQTLRATLDWSYQLLPQAEQVLFRQLAVFAGSWTLQAAEAVGASDGGEEVMQRLGSLVEKNLLRRVWLHPDEPRFDMLETIREYGRRLLAEAGDEGVVRQRLAAYYQGIAETAERALLGVDHAYWMALLASEQDNLRAVLAWALEVGEIERGLAIASAIWHFWWVRGQLAEGQRWLDELLAKGEHAASPTAMAAKALNAAGGLALGNGNYERAQERYEHSVEAGTALNDGIRAAIGLHNLGYLAAEQGDAERAVTCVEASLARSRALGDTALVAVGLTTLGEAMRQRGELVRAAALLEQGLALLRQLGNQLWQVAALRHLAEVARDRSDWSAAEARYKEALRACESLGDGYPLGVARCFEGLAEVAVKHGQAAHAARLLGAAARVRAEIGAPVAPVSRAVLQQVEKAAGAGVGDASFQAAFEEGGGLQRAESVTLALLTSSLGPLPSSPEPPAAEQARHTAIAPPPVRAQLVSRTRLVARLDDALARALTLLSAPAGSGKTSLLVDWAAHASSRALVAWVTLDRADDDPPRFWRQVLAALQAQRSGLGSSAMSLVRAGSSGYELVVDELIADLAGLDRDLVLILDDYHVIESEVIHAGVSYLVNRSPRQLHVVLSSRVDPPLGLARRRTAGDLVELRAADLRLSDAEAAELLGAVVGRALTETQVHAVTARTEGWAAGLQLAGLSLRESAEPHTAISRLSGTDRFLVDYFIEEVLAVQPIKTRQFLQRTSILNRLNGPLCDAVLASSGSAATLLELERKSLFISALDESGSWYRYHQLFAEVLHLNLQRDEPDLEADLHARATAWYVANGLQEEGIEQALAGKHWLPAARLMASKLEGMLQHGEEVTVNRWLSALPSELYQGNGQLSVIRALALMQLGQMATAQSFMLNAEHSFSEAGDEEALGAICSLYAFLSAMRDDAATTFDYAERALRLLSGGPPRLRVMALTGLARGHLLAGRAGAAAQALERALPLVNVPAFPAISWQFHLALASLRLIEGRLRLAAAQFSTVLAMVAERPVFARQAALIGLAVVAYQQNELDDAADFLDRVDEARREAARSVDLPFPALVRAWVARARGDTDVAAEAVERCESAALGIAHTRLQRTARAFRAQLALDSHDLASASAWADEVDASAGDLVEYAREPEVLMLARVWLAHGHAERAVQELATTLERAERDGRGASVLRISTLLAVALAQTGRQAEGVELLRRSLTSAEAERWVRVFADEGVALLPLLRVAASKRAPLAAFIARISVRGEPGGLLTVREREVLELLADGLSNRAMAARLVTSEATVKSHVHHLITKFGVSTRAEVLVSARRQGLLPNRHAPPKG